MAGRAAAQLMHRRQAAVEGPFGSVSHRGHARRRSSHRSFDHEKKRPDVTPHPGFLRILPARPEDLGSGMPAECRMNGAEIGQGRDLACEPAVGKRAARREAAGLGKRPRGGTMPMISPSCAECRPAALEAACAAGPANRAVWVQTGALRAPTVRIGTVQNAPKGWTKPFGPSGPTAVQHECCPLSH